MLVSLTLGGGCPRSGLGILAGWILFATMMQAMLNLLTRKTLIGLLLNM